MDDTNNRIMNPIIYDLILKYLTTSIRYDNNNPCIQLSCGRWIMGLPEIIKLVYQIYNHLIDSSMIFKAMNNGK